MTWESASHECLDRHREAAMENLTWIAIMLAMFAVTFIHVRLCDNA